jgi:hypothetical protein
MSVAKGSPFATLWQEFFWRKEIIQEIRDFCPGRLTMTPGKNN